MVRADEDAGHVGGETIMSRPGRAPAVPGWQPTSSRDEALDRVSGVGP
jgi:hypothetical protein